MKSLLSIVLIVLGLSLSGWAQTLQPVGSKVMVSSSKVMVGPSKAGLLPTVPNRTVALPPGAQQGVNYYYGYGNYYQGGAYRSYRNAPPRPDPFNYNGSSTRQPLRPRFPRP